MIQAAINVTYIPTGKLRVYDKKTGEQLGEICTNKGTGLAYFAPANGVVIEEAALENIYQTIKGDNEYFKLEAARRLASFSQKQTSDQK